MLSIVIQAGGESRRMGGDKALLDFLGRPLIQRVIERVRLLGEEILVVTNRPEAYQFLNLPLKADLWPGTGALGGLGTALTVADQPLVANIACDMPFVNAEILARGAAVLAENRAVDAFVPITEHGYEPFHAVYRRKTCLAAVSKALAAGERRMISWFEGAEIYNYPAGHITRNDPDMRAFWNLNTPAEFEEAENLARVQP